MTTAAQERLPGFIIIGRPKCGTTSLARWLSEQPEIFFCKLKEPRFFVRDDLWKRGPDWYRSLYAGAASGQLLGEATPAYTHPHESAKTAQRIFETSPDVRLVYLVRDPAARIRSAYRHRRMSTDERKSTLAEALAEPGNIYERYTLYFTCLEPYIERFPREQILVVRMEDLVGESASGWDAVLDHLGLGRRPRPDTAHNVSAERGVSRAPLRLLRRFEFRRRLAWLPDPIRTVGRTILNTRGPRFEHVLDASQAPLPPEALAPVWNDISQLESWLGVGQPLWTRGPQLTPRR